MLLDIQMPEMTGIEALKEIKACSPCTKVVMLTTFEDIESITASFEAGADGYLVKDMKQDVLIMAIKCIYHNLVILHREAYSILFPSRRTSAEKSSDRIMVGDVSFDRTDILLMKQIANGRSNKEIALMLNYSEGTVKNRVSRLLSMTGLSDRTQISVFALKNNLI
jgi:DNA-binding NarL/FixJ family response regulator